MNQKKTLSTVVIGIMLLSIAVAFTPVINAALPDYDVIGFVFVDGVETDDVEITLSVPDQEDITVISYYYEFIPSHGAYIISFYADEGQNASFAVHYGYNYFIPDPDGFLIDQPHPHTYSVDLYIYTDTTNPPDPPDLTAPGNGHSFDAGTTTVTLQAQVTDPDGDMMDVYFYNADGNSLIGTHVGVEDGGTAQVDWSVNDGNTYSWYAVASDSIRESAVSDTWSFTTKSSGGDNGGNGGNGGNGDNGYTPTGNSNPIADASASETVGFINTPINFDGSGSSDPDGDTLTYAWEFDDGNTGSGETITHTYTSTGAYTVTLTVDDGNGGTDDDTIQVIISQPNLPPTAPTVTGNQTGNKNTEYSYTAVSTDDDNDTIKYTFNWGDGETTTTELLANGTEATQNHTWTSAGKYTIRVKANDNQTDSGTTEYTVLIDAIDVDDIGYMTDDDGDGTYDKYHDNGETVETITEKQTNGTYLLDTDGDDSWNYYYDPDTDTLTLYGQGTTTAEEGDNTMWYMLGAGIIIVILLGVGISKATKKKKKKKK